MSGLNLNACELLQYHCGLNSGPCSSHGSITQLLMAASLKIYFERGWVVTASSNWFRLSRCLLNGSIKCRCYRISQEAFFPMPASFKSNSMRTALYLALLLACVGLLPAQDSFYTTGEARQSLDGQWDFTTDASVASQSDGWAKMSVPGNWDTHPEYSTYSGKGWYRRTFTVPDSWKGKPIRLRFEAVFQQASISLNGQDLGSHFGGYTPFEFDVTQKLIYGGTNTLVVCADNTYHRGAWWPWGGISRSVELIANNDTRVVWQHIDSDPDLSMGTAQVTIHYLLHNSAVTPKDVQLGAQITYPGAPDFVASQNAHVVLAGNADSPAEIDLSLPSGVHLWDFDHPHLYTLTSTLQENGQTLHTAKDRFGIRKIQVTAEGLFLNGEKIRVAGFNRVGDSNQYGNTEPDSLVRTDIDLMKSAGAVMSRLMHVPQAPKLLDYLDEKGMLIYCEVPVWGGGDPEMKPNNPVTKQWLREMIDRDYNHPCIIGWSMGNELSGQYAYVASMAEYVRTKLDSSRLVGYVSNTAGEVGYNPKNDPVTVSDIAMINKYGGPVAFAGPPATVRNRWPDKPIFFSEYGVRQIGPSPNARIPQIDEVWATIEKQPYVIGGALWSFNDYRSGFKNTPASGNREWGVVDIDRHPKGAYWQIRKLYSPVHSITLANGTVTVQPRTSEEIPSYALRGYQITWKLSDATDSVTAQGTIALPNLPPDAPAWSAPIPGAASAASMSVSLISPTGYDVDGASSSHSK